MAKIVQISDGVVVIGTDAGGLKEVRMMDLNFNPIVGDEVEIFETENKTIINKKNIVSNDNMPNGGININLTNSNNNAPSPVYIANGTKAVNKVVYCVLALFLGCIGVHKFYSGKVGTGIVFILLCWTGIPAVIGFFDFIVAICKHADGNGNILV